MNVFASLRTLASRLFDRSQPNTDPDTDLDDELRSHIEHRADDLERTGLPRAEAWRRARIEFGGYERYREEAHQAMGRDFAETFMQDLRLSLRTMRKKPAFTAVAILTLALAIGANAVVFAVLNALVLRPLDVPQAQSLYAIFHDDGKDSHQSYPGYLDLRDRNRSFDGLAAFNVLEAGLDTGKNPSRVWVYEITGNYFDVLRQQPYLGHFFHGSDEHGPNSAPFIVLSYAYWHTHFHDDRGVVGRVVQLNRHPFTILAVAPPLFHGTLLFFDPDLFTPIVNHAQLAEDDMNDRGSHWIFMTLGHLKPGIAPARAVAELNSIGASLGKTYPKTDGKWTYSLGRPSLYGDYLGRPIRAFMAGLMLLSGLILLAACANLGSLFAARAAERSREMALRLALGSSRRRILRCLFTEALLISLCGGAFGLLGSLVLLRSLSVWRPFPLWPIHLSVNPDAHVYLVALLLTLASGFFFGAVPVRQVLRTNPYEVVKSGSAGSVGRSGRRITVRDVLLVVQISICAVLVTASIVAVRGLGRSLHNNFGFEVRNKLLISTNLMMAGYRGDRVPAMQKRMVDALSAIPGVESVGLADSIPLGDYASNSIVYADSTTDLRPANVAAKPYVFKVAPEYLHAAGTPLLSGRAFTWHDDRSSPRVAVVNREFARKLFGSEAKAMGGYYKMPDGARVQVVGTVEDGKYASLSDEHVPAMFLPILQWPSSQTLLVVRSSRDPQQLGAAVRSTLQRLDSALPIEIQTQYSGLDALLFGPRMATITLGVLGIMGAMLAITGIFGMAAYSVSKRLRELGIRIALGAQRREVLEAALGRTFRLLALGSVVGLVLGVAAGKLLAYIVYQATPWDPVVLAGVMFTMLALGLLAGWIPALRALATDPLILLRDD
jgi:predicted permease